MDGRNSTSPSAIQQGIDAYRQWKSQVEHAIREFEQWLADSDATTAEATAQIQDCLAAIGGDRLTVTLIASDPTRTATLVNALLFPGHGRPLLPLNGQLPPCPITLRWDEAEQSAYLRLLPDETAAPANAPWIHHSLTGDTPEPYANQVLRLLQAATPGACAWRQILISLPHPLLQQGLTIQILPALVKPNQDQSTMQALLPRSQGILLALDAADITDTAQGFWWQDLQVPCAEHPQDIVVALDMPDPTRIGPTTPSAPSADPSPREQQRQVAATLDLPVGQIVPISLGLGLAARLRQDAGLLQRSRLPKLERTVASRLLEAKHRDIIALLDEGIGLLAQGHYAQISNQLIHIQGLIQELAELHERSDKVAERLIAQTQNHRTQYVDAVARFQAFRSEILAATAHCRTILARPNIDALIEAGHNAMVKSWTTHGLGLAMKDLLDSLRARMQTVTDESEGQRQLVRRAYDEFRILYDLELATPRVFVPTRYHVELELLYQEAEELRRSRLMTFAEQARVIERFHQQIASRARVLFDQLRLNFDPWLHDVLQPLADAIEEHQAMMETRLQSLGQIQRSSTGLAQRIAGLRAEQSALNDRLMTLRKIENTLYHAPTLADPPSRPAWPKLPTGGRRRG